MADMTQEEKAKKAEQAAKARAARQAKKEAEVAKVKDEATVQAAEPTISMEELEALRKENMRLKQELQNRDEKLDAMDERMRKLEQMQSQPSVVQVQTEKPEVKLRYQSECSPENTIIFGQNGKFGSFTGKSATFSVPKESFGGEFRDTLVQHLLETRELIVLDGLTDEERELYGVSYRKGEYLDDKTFKRLTSMGTELVDMYDDLCETYKIMLARRFAEEFEKHPESVRRDIILKLNEKSKKDYKDLPDGDNRKKGAFHAVIEAMNKRDTES